MSKSNKRLTPRLTIELLRELFDLSKEPDARLDPSTGTAGFLFSALQNHEKHNNLLDSPSNELSKPGRDAADKLDGVWSVQLFFRTWPYYARRANNLGDDPFQDSDVIISEQLPLPDMPAETRAKLELFLKQLWAMSIVYIEAILEHYFLGLIEEFSLIKEERRPSQARSLYRYLQDKFNLKYEYSISISPDVNAQLWELNATRHLWVHRNGIVDATYLKESNAWWQDRPKDWFEKEPQLGSERLLSETYIKSSIYFSRKLIQIVDEQIAPYLGKGDF